MYHKYYEHPNFKNIFNLSTLDQKKGYFAEKIVLKVRLEIQEQS